MKPALELADILKKNWPAIELSPHINSWQLRTLSAIKICRTDALGGHKAVCTECGVLKISYNSCRNRHCPKCQGKEREQWIEKRKDELLPVQYFHIVFTLPDTFNTLAMYEPKVIYDTLFQAAWQTIEIFSRDHKFLGANTGMISILHTWGQQLTLHPHIHCIVPQGGLTKNGQWKYAKSQGKYLFPVRAMSKVFRAKYLAIIRKKIAGMDKKLLNVAYKKSWVVYAKKPFGGAESVMEYLGRYTHKIAISNHRIIDIKNGITFKFKDYKDGAKTKEMMLEPMEFIRRFALHILPKGFVRIRHYGILSSTSKKNTIPIMKEIFKDVPVSIYKDKRETEPYNPLYCVHCKKETMVLLEIIPRRGPPENDSKKKYTVENCTQ